MTSDGFPEPLPPAVSRQTTGAVPRTGASLPPFAGGETLSAGPRPDAEDLLPDIGADAERPEPLPLGPSTVEDGGAGPDAFAADTSDADENFPDWLDATLGLAPEGDEVPFATPITARSAPPAADEVHSDLEDLPDWLEETLGIAKEGTGEGDVIHEPAEGSTATDDDFPDWLEQTLATVETHGDVGIAAESVEEADEDDEQLLDVSELLGEPEPAAGAEREHAADGTGGAAEQVADRLERIARTLREGGAGALNDPSDPLALLVTGFILGYEQREHGG